MVLLLLVYQGATIQETNKDQQTLETNFCPVDKGRWHLFLNLNYDICMKNHLTTVGITAPQFFGIVKSGSLTP